MDRMVSKTNRGTTKGGEVGMNEPETSKQTVYGTWKDADEIPYYPNVFERIWNLIKNVFTRRK